MRFITLVCSGISSAVLYVAMLLMVAVNWTYGLIGVVFEIVEEVVDYHLGNQIDLFNESIKNRNKRN
jgi:hypothetical protein